MGLRRLLDRAVTRMDERGERAHAAELAKLTPAEQERHRYWERRAEAARNGTPVAALGDHRLVGKVLQGPAGDIVHGVTKAPKQPVIEDPAAWERQMRAERAARDRVLASYLAPGRRPRPHQDILARAGVGPERALGVARRFAIHKSGGGDDGGASRIDAVVTGVHLLVEPGAAAAVGAAAQGAPWRIAAGPPPAWVTYDRRFDLFARTSTSTSSHVRRTGGGPDLPCADGTPRKRMAGGHHVVIAYRDSPAYVEGRARFDAYAEGELQAFLRRGLGLREPIPEPAGRVERTLDRVADVVDFFSAEPTWDGGDEDRPRYCRPPRG